MQAEADQNLDRPKGGFECDGTCFFKQRKKHLEMSPLGTEVVSPSNM